MNRAQKDLYVKELKSKWERSRIALFADYRGLTALKADALRKQMRAQGVEVRVLKNSMARWVTQKGAFGEGPEKLAQNLGGPTLVAFAYDDSLEIARIFQQFAQENEAFQLKESLVGRDLISPAQIKVLAELPAKPVLVARFLGTLVAPVSRFLGIFQAVPRSFVQVLSAIEKKKEQSPSV